MIIINWLSKGSSSDIKSNAASSSSVLTTQSAPSTSAVAAAIPHLKSSFTDTFGDSFNPSPILSSQLNTLMPPPNKSAKVKTNSNLGVSHYSTIRPRKKTSKEPDLAALTAIPPPVVSKLTAARSLSGSPNTQSQETSSP